MYYQEELLEEIRTQNDIVDVIGEYLPLKQKGTSYFGLCPFHNESTPSFSVVPDKQFYYCFGCGAAGNVFSFLMQMENCDFVEAVKRLADRVNIPLPEYTPTKEAKQAEKQKNILLELHKTAGRFYYEKLHSPFGGQALDYLKSRKIQPNIQRKFGIGYAPNSTDLLYQHLKQKGYSPEEMIKSGLVMEKKGKNGYRDRFFRRLMFPIFDIQSRIIGFGGRILEQGEPKYLNSPETTLFNKSQTLYGLNFAKASRKKEIILVEGYLDMISVYQAGFHNVAASLGTAFNQEHAKILKKFATDVILLFDSDDAGTKAALRAIPVLSGNGFRVKVAQVPDGKDPDGYLRQKGTKAMSLVLGQAKSSISFQLYCIRKEYPLQTTEHKVAFTTKSAEILSKIPSAIEQDAYIKEVSSYSGITAEAIQNEIIKLQKKAETDFIKKSTEKRTSAFSTSSVLQNQKSKGLLEAQRDLLNFCITDALIYEKIKQYVSSDAFLEPVYVRLAELIADFKKRNQPLFPAELLNYFPSVEQQQLVAKVFTEQKSYETRQDLEKALNEEIRMVWNAKIDQMAASATEIETINKLIEKKRNLNEMRISITNE